ncbi:Hsp33 family molecular chaperone HslO [Acetobacteraceae bacterium ESL0709]|nr:Hsp33 family molecular chaperone HslO [Acetobacteraceae bacterium ESL0697]MDF7678499.1 Hsp33 family molecular chaperone HslO [Acetobacteraceae bacterium ESL0709]
MTANDMEARPETLRPEGVPNLSVPHAVLPFYLAHAPVRGRLVRLGPLAHALLSRHNYPDEVLKLGGQALALVACMATALKFEGSFSLQIKGDGPVSLLLADCTDKGALRFTAQLNEEAPSRLPAEPSALLGKGYLAFTVDQGADTERHQGIVALEGDSLSGMAEHYFSTSEQYPCFIRLFSERLNGEWQAAALVLERIAGEGGQAQELTDNDEFDDAWETACTFAASLKQSEIFDHALGSSALVRRLFGTLDVVEGTFRPLSFGCRCNRERLATLLETFGDDDLDHMAEDGIIQMDCNFCNTHFTFPRDTLSHTGHKASMSIS